MKNFPQFCLAVFATLVFGLGWPVIWAEIALAIFALLAIIGDSKKIEAVEILLPFMAIILFHQKPDLWLVCLSMSAFLAVWNATELITGIKEKLK